MKVRRVSRPVAGFRAAGVHVGIKDVAKDLALIVADEPATVAAIFTQSSVVGAPEAVSRARLARGRTRGVIVNSGVANVAMGKRGLRDAKKMAAMAARAIHCDEDEMLVASTGAIGAEAGSFYVIGILLFGPQRRPSFQRKQRREATGQPAT